MSSKGKMALLAVVALFFMTLSCGKFAPYKKGELINFSALSSSVQTKAQYSGEVVDGKEYVDWSEGDIVRIYCAEASEPLNGYADYRVYDVLREETFSKASIVPLDMGLRWGDEIDHNFYAVWPCPEGTDLWDSNQPGLYHGSLASEQSSVSVNVSSGEYTVVPDFTNQCMGAKYTINHGTSDPAPLIFLPFVTAFQFTLENGCLEGGDLTFSRAFIESAAKFVAGPYVADFTTLNQQGTALPTITVGTEGVSKKVAASFGEDGVTISPGEKISFTIFLMPGQDFNDITLGLVKKNGDVMSLALTKDGAGIEFKQGKKYMITGLVLPQEIILKDFTVTEWGNNERGADLGEENSQDHTSS